MLDTALRLVREARPGRERVIEAWGEAFALLRSGLGRRRELASTVTRQIVSGWRGDVRFGLRTLRRHPGLALASSASLGLGLGATAAIFSLVDGVLLTPPPYERPEDLVLVWHSVPDSPDRIPVQGPDAAVLDERARTLGSVAFSIRGVDGSIAARPGETPRHVRIAAVTQNFFTTLGVRPQLGRGFLADEGVTTPAAEAAMPVVVLSDRVWRAAFGADPTLLGRSVVLNGTPVTVAGIAPAGFALALPPDAGVMTDVDVWTPLSISLSDFHREDGRLLDRDSDNTGVVVARLADGASLEDAQAEASAVATQLRGEFPAYAQAELDFDLRALHDDATTHARPLLTALLVSAGVMLLITALNVTTLLLARGMDRAREYSIRGALGGGRVRLVRQLFVEGSALAVVGVVVGLAVAEGTLVALRPMIPPELAPLDGVRIDATTLTLLAVLGIAATLLFGVVSATQALAGYAGGRSSVSLRAGSVERSPARSVLVVGQVALSVALLLGAGLLLRTVDALQDVRPGFETQGVLTFRTSMRAPDRYRSPRYRAELTTSIRADIEALPGVRAGSAWWACFRLAAIAGPARSGYPDSRSRRGTATAPTSRW